MRWEGGDRGGAIGTWLDLSRWVENMFSFSVVGSKCLHVILLKWINFNVPAFYQMSTIIVSIFLSGCRPLPVVHIASSTVFWTSYTVICIVIPSSPEFFSNFGLPFLVLSIKLTITFICCRIFIIRCISSVTSF